MLTDALIYPTRDENWVLKVLIGGLLSVATFLIFPLFLVMGYLLWVMRYGIEKRFDAMPRFEEWGKMLVDGFLGMLILVLYAMVPNGLIVLGLAARAFEALAGVLILVGLILNLAMLYLLPVGLANFIRRDRFSSAFDLKFIGRVGLNSHYLMSWLLGLVIGFVVGSVSAVLSIMLVGVFITFYVNVCLFYLLGYGVAKSL